jgi:hypothetical protein
MSATEQLKAVTREAHAAIKDLEKSMKDARLLLKSMETVKDELMAVSDQVFEQRMQERVDAGLDLYSKSLDKAIEDATEATYRRFDTLSDIMLGGNGDGQKLARVVEARNPEAIIQLFTEKEGEG